MLMILCECAKNGRMIISESGKHYKIVCAGYLLGVIINRFKSSFQEQIFTSYLVDMK